MKKKHDIINRVKAIFDNDDVVDLARMLRLNVKMVEYYLGRKLTVMEHEKCVDRLVDLLRTFHRIYREIGDEQYPAYYRLCYYCCKQVAKEITDRQRDESGHVVREELDVADVRDTCETLFRLASLKPKVCLVLRMYFFDGKTLEAIGAEFSCTKQYVSLIIHKAVDILKERHRGRSQEFLGTIRRRRFYGHCVSEEHL